MKTKRTDLPVYQNSSGEPQFIQLPPLFWELMRIGPIIPATFWKLTFVVWRGIIAPKKVPGTTDQFEPDWTFTITARQFLEDYQINKTAASDWTHAYEVSGLFRIDYGKRNDKGNKQIPTTWRYRTASTRRDWECFILGLSNACKLHKDHHWKRQGTDIRPMKPKEFEESLASDDPNDTVEEKVRKRIAGRAIYGNYAFQLSVALATDNQRIKAGLSSVNDKFIEWCVKEGIANRSDDVIEWRGARTARQVEDEMPSY